MDCRECAQTASPRLVDVDVIDAVDARREGRRTAYLRTTKGQLLGRPVEGKHMLAGFLVCSCVATFEVVRGFYRCSARRRKGPNVCPSETVFKVEEIENSFLKVLESSVLNPEFITRVVDAVFAGNTDAERQAVVTERNQVARKIENLTKALRPGAIFRRWPPRCKTAIGS